MSEVIFLPHYRDVLESVLRQAEVDGPVDVECRPDIDPAVVAAQLRHYANLTGRVLECRQHRGRVEVWASRGEPTPHRTRASPA